MTKFVRTATAFHRAAIYVVIAGAAGMFATGASTLFEPPAADIKAELAKATTSAAPASEERAAKTATKIALSASAALARPVGVMLASSTGKLWDLFREIGYEIDGVRARGEVPRLFLASLPHDLKTLTRASLRKITFIKSTLPLILHVNELIMQDRKRLISIGTRLKAGDRLPAPDAAWLTEMAETYGLDRPDPVVLLDRMDVIPPSLAIAQAAEESGWGTSRFAQEGNALFGQRSYRAHRKGIVPLERAEGKGFKVRAFDHLIDGVKAYAHNLNSHFAYAEFRSRRAEMRAATGHIDGHSLAGTLMSYSERGDDYIKTIRLIMRFNALQVFDAARLGDSVAPDA